MRTTDLCDYCKTNEIDGCLDDCSPSGHMIYWILFGLECLLSVYGTYVAYMFLFKTKRY
jgi:hypothetical protein